MRMPTLKFESIKVEKQHGDVYIQIKGEIASEHPSYKIGEKIWTSHVVYYDELINMIHTTNGLFYRLQVDDNDKKLELLSVLARKNNISNVG